MIIPIASYLFCSTVITKERDDLVNPFWMVDEELTRGQADYLTGSEIQFWKDIIDKYLYPIDEDRKEKVNRLFCLLPFTTLTAN